MRWTSTISIALLLTSLTMSHAQENNRLWRGVYLFDRDSVNLQQMRDSLGLNEFQYRTGFRSWDNIALTDTNLKLINQRDIPQFFSSGQRMKYEAEQSYDSLLLKNYFDLHETGGVFPVQNPEAWRCTTTVHSAGYMVNSAKPNDQYGNGKTSFLATFRLKVGGTPADTTALVARCIVFCLTHLDTLKDSLLHFNDFNTTNYKDFILPFSLIPPPPSNPPHNDTSKFLSGGAIQRSPPSICTNVDLQVYWYGNVTTYLDNVVVEDSLLGHGLFTGVFDSTIKADAGKAASYSAHELFYLRDEPIISQFLAFNYVGNLIKDTLGEFNPHAGTVTAQYQHFKRFLTDAKPTHLMVDPYFIGADIPHPSPNISDADAAEAGFTTWSYAGYTSSLQSHTDIALKNFFRLAAAITSTTNGYDTLIFIPQLHGILNSVSPKTYFTLRPPSPSELRLQFNLGMAYGAKGFVSYPYEQTDSLGYVDANGVSYVVAFPGLVAGRPVPYQGNLYYMNHSSNFDTLFAKRIWTGYKEKWDALGVCPSNSFPHI
jgi:hypothetical protein